MSKKYDWYVVYQKTIHTEYGVMCTTRLKVTDSPNITMSMIESWKVDTYTIVNIMPVNREMEPK